MYVMLDLQRSWEVIRPGHRWWDTAAELGHQFDPTLVVAARISRRYGDRQDRGAIELAVKRFF